jgi:hypothetical protein
MREQVIIIDGIDVKFRGYCCARTIRSIFFTQRMMWFFHLEGWVDFMDQALDCALDLGISAFSFMTEANLAMFIEKVHRRPTPISIGLPDFLIGIHDDRPRNA